MRLTILLLAGLTMAHAQVVWFEPNRGQVAGQTEWVGRSKGAYLYITGNEIVYANSKNVRMRLVGASKHPRVEGVEPTGGISSYFTGRDEKTWFTGIPHYSRLKYRDVYPGIDLVYYGSGANVEYDFVVRPGGDPDRIELAFSDPVKIEGGDLVVAGLRQHRPRVVQGGREIAARYRITADRHVQIALGEFDQTCDLTVDPVLEFSTYFGGPGADSAIDVKVDAVGNIYLAGATQSPASPSLNPFQQTNIVALAPFVMKLSPDATRVLYFAVLGSGGWDDTHRMALDSNNNPVLVGDTRTPNFPLKNAFQSDYRGAYWNGFITKLSADGRSLIYSSFLGGKDSDDANAVVLDAQGSAYVAGTTWSEDGFPLKNAIQSRFAGGSSDCYAARIAPEGALLWATYFGGAGNESCFDIALGDDGNPIIVGASNTTDFPLYNAIQTEITPRTGLSAPMLFKMASDGQSVLVSTFLGGPTAGDARAVAVDSVGNVLIGGGADARFVVKNAVQTYHPPDGYTGYLLKMDPMLRSVLFATNFGGSGNSWVATIALDALNAIYLAGPAGAKDFPLKNSLQAFRGGGILQDDCYAAKLSPAGTVLIYSTLLGGSGNESCRPLAVDRSGNAYVAGGTWSFDLPVKNAFQSMAGGGEDAFLAKISDTTPIEASPLTVSPSRVVFQFVQGGPAPPSQAVTVTGGVFVAATEAPWLAANVTGTNVSVSVNPAGLTYGSYTGSVTLTPQAGGTPATADAMLTVLEAPAILTSVDPSVVPAGSDDTVITIHGSGFTTKSVLQVYGVPWSLTPVEVIDSSTLKFTLPVSYLNVQGSFPVAVQNPNSPVSNALSISVGIPAPHFTAASVTNAGSFAGGPVAPGEIVTIFGANLTGAVTFDNVPATMIYSSPTQMSVTVPNSVRGPTTTLQIGSSVPVKLDVAPSAPGISAAVEDPENRVVTLYATGCGPLSLEELPRCRLPVSVTINDQDAPVLYAGIAPGLPEGANQINVRVPDGVSSGPVRIVLKAGDASSKPFDYSLQ